MTEKEEKVIEALSYVIEPDLKKDIISAGLVKNLQIDGNAIKFDLQISNPAMHNRRRIEEACLHHLQTKVDDNVQVEINFVSLPKQTERPPELRTVLPNVKNLIAVGSGKGGVGKSTVTANLAVALAKEGYKVGLIDADIYGPSMPLMFDVQKEKPVTELVDGKQLIKPIESYGVKLLSIGFFADTDQAIVWRGAMATKALKQLILDANWGELDFLLFDLPPGTGDIHLTLVQTIPLTGAVVVSTPQEVALIDARKAVGMFRLPQINVPVLGFIENMSYFTPAELPDNKYYIFGKEGMKSLSEKMQIPLLGEIPLVQSIREGGDVGRPVVLQEDTPQAKAFKQAALNLVEKVNERNEKYAPTNIVQITTMSGCSTK
tara:strand:- start:31289 stop:32416 length:1128 start_codon:yes stop_codon:yes gene_type:complete